MIGVSNITNRTDPNSLKSRLFVGNLNTVHMLKSELETVFSKYGAIIGISVHKGYAFVQYVHETSARAAVIGEDGKVYYNMALDVTIASEPKTRKRIRSNINANIPTCHTIPDLLTLPTQQPLPSNHLSSSVISSLQQQLGLEGLMGQPNFAQFAAAANTVLTAAAAVSNSSFSPIAISSNTGSSTNIPNLFQTRPKYSRPTSTSSHASLSSVSNLSSLAKRTRLEASIAGGSSLMGSLGQLPSGARGQNLVSLVSPADTTASTAKSTIKQKLMSPVKTSSARLSSSTTGSWRDSVKSEPFSKIAIGKSSKSMSLVHQSSKQPTDADRGVQLSAVTGSGNSEDILICGTCRRLFDQVDELISHKMAGCSLGRVTCEACRCRSDEPSDLECAYCGANFHTAWQLMHHCHNDHGLTIYSLPSRSSSSTPSPEHVPSSPVQHDSSVTHNDKDRLSAEDLEFNPLNNHCKPESGGADGTEQDNSDWEAGADDYHEVAEAPEPSDNEVEAEDVLATESAECSVHLNRVDDGDEVKTDADASPARQQQQQKHKHRRRRGEYGRHETVDDEEEEDEDEEEVQVKVTRSK